jgi:hypothetical protein
MQTECSEDLLGFVPVERRVVVAGFDGGGMTSDAGCVAVGATDRAIGLVGRFAACFTDGRSPELIVDLSLAWPRTSAWSARSLSWTPKIRQVANILGSGY